LNTEPGDASNVVRDCSELFPSDEILREALIRTGLKDVCEFLSAVPSELNVAIPVDGMAAAHRHPSET
jgi:hypothetical protein